MSGNGQKWSVPSISIDLGFFSIESVFTSIDDARVDIQDLDFRLAIKTKVDNLFFIYLISKSYWKLTKMTLKTKNVHCPE